MIEIVTEGELKSLSAVVMQEVEQALEERAMLGMTSPQDFEVRIRYYNYSHAASAYVDGSRLVMELNCLPIAFSKFNEQEKSDAVCVSDYFDLGREFIPDGEEQIIRMMEHPIKTLNELEDEQGDELDYFKDFFGQNYNMYWKEAVRGAKLARESFRRIKPRVIEILAREGFSGSPIRHELDHLDFLQTRLGRKHEMVGNRIYDLEVRLDLGDDETLDDYSMAIATLLKLDSEVMVLEEVRAAFFNHINMGEWAKANYEDVKRKVYGWFHYHYLERTLPLEITEKLILKLFNSSEIDDAIDDETGKYLLRVIHDSLDTIGSLRFQEDRTKVNYDLVNKILYKELPRWKLRFANNAARATDAMGNTFRDDPTRFAAANDAKTFNEYINILEKI